MKDTLTRFKLVTDRSELLLPACSYFSRADNDPYWIDTDVDSDDGRIYIGQSDFEQMAKILGWVPEVKNVDLLKLELLENENARLRAVLGNLRVVLSELHPRSEEPNPAVVEDTTGDDTAPVESPPNDSGKVSKPVRRLLESLNVEDDDRVQDSL